MVIHPYPVEIMSFEHIYRVGLRAPQPRMTDLHFDRDFDVTPGEAVAISPLVRRVLANNPSPFTFKGTSTFIVGRGQVAVIDPGPR